MDASERGRGGEAQKEADDWLWPPLNRTQAADKFINPTGGNGFGQRAKLHTHTHKHTIRLVHKIGIKVEKSTNKYSGIKDE